MPRCWCNTASSTPSGPLWPQGSSFFWPVCPSACMPHAMVSTWTCSPVARVLATSGPPSPRSFTPASRSFFLRWRPPSWPMRWSWPSTSRLPGATWCVQWWCCHWSHTGCRSSASCRCGRSPCGWSCWWCPTWRCGCTNLVHSHRCCTTVVSRAWVLTSMCFILVPRSRWALR